MAAFKDGINRGSVAELAAAIEPHVPGLDAAGFRRNAVRGLGPLELKARIGHVARALDSALPGQFAAMAPHVAAGVAEAELSLWEAWPALTWVEIFGVEDPAPALDALGRMTSTASAEFAIRPYIEAHPGRTWKRLGRWSRSRDEHQRRLASEGTRPRLPWGRRVASLIDEPERGIEVLDRLHRDESEYVRRSVANHLNDVARDHPELAIATAERWLDGGGAHSERVVRHALRGLVKKGDPRALRLIGADVDAPVTVDLTLGAERVRIGEELPFAVQLTATGPAAATCVVDYAVSYARPSGRPSRKVFKLKTVTLPPGELVSIDRKLKLRDVSIRTHHPGTHAIELIVNGRVAARRPFELFA